MSSFFCVSRTVERRRKMNIYSSIPPSSSSSYTRLSLLCRSLCISTFLSSFFPIRDGSTAPLFQPLLLSWKNHDSVRPDGQRPDHLGPIDYFGRDGANGAKAKPESIERPAHPDDFVPIWSMYKVRLAPPRIFLHPKREREKPNNRRLFFPDLEDPPAIMSRTAAGTAQNAWKGRNKVEKKKKKKKKLRKEKTRG